MRKAIQSVVKCLNWSKKVEVVKSAAERTAAILEKNEEGFKVVAPIASCALMLKSHWPLLCPENKKVQKLSKILWILMNFCLVYSRGN